MLNLLLMVLALGLMITIHETGHFLVARAFGVGIYKFSIGFGRAIAEFERKGIKYRIAWIPLGGYVKMKGENPNEDEEHSIEGSSFTRIAWWKKALIAFSGPFANLILAAVLLFVAFLLPQKQEDTAPVIHNAEGKWAEIFQPADSIMAVNGKQIKGFNEFLLQLDNSKANIISLARGGASILVKTATGEADSLIKSLQPRVEATIGDVFTGMPAWRAGLKPGDRVLAVDSVSIYDWNGMREQIINTPNRQVNLKILRGTQILARQIELEQNVALGDQRMIGISYDLPIKSTTYYTVPQAALYGFRSTVGFVTMYYVSLFKLFQQPEQLKNSLAGPVMIATISQQMGQRGLSYLVIFFASISLILMIMNLLPIPVLDGGHILFALYEGIFGRPLPVKVQGILQRIGLVLLLTVFAYAFFSDISKLLLRLFALNQ